VGASPAAVAAVVAVVAGDPIIFGKIGFNIGKTNFFILLWIIIGGKIGLHGSIDSYSCNGFVSVVY